MKAIQITFFVLVTIVVSLVGCVAPTRHPDPLAGWKVCFSQNPIRSNKAILDDYQDYIKKLPPEERKFVGSIKLFEDGTGQHAVRIEVDLDGTRWAHILIYDKENRRIRVIKYAASQYRS